MTSPPNLPYFDYLLALLAANNASVEKSFGRHVHWGYWPDPAKATADDDDYARAAEQLTMELCHMADVGAGERVLDAGCGFGGTIASINERFDGMRLTGVNIDERQLERARRQVKARPSNSVEFRLGDACDMPFDDASFDRVLAVECIFHFPSRERFFAEAFRVLRPGGTLALSDFVPAAPFVPLVRYATHSPSLARFQYFGQFNVQFTLGDYRRLARKSGFVPLVRRNATRNTQPTYLYLTNLLRQSGAIEGITERVADVVPFLRWVGKLGLMRYELLAFRKAG